MIPPSFVLESWAETSGHFFTAVLKILGSVSSYFIVISVYMEKKPVTMKKHEFLITFFAKNRNFINLSRYFTINYDIK